MLHWQLDNWPPGNLGLGIQAAVHPTNTRIPRHALITSQVLVEYRVPTCPKSSAEPTSPVLGKIETTQAISSSTCREHTVKRSEVVDTRRERSERRRARVANTTLKSLPFSQENLERKPQCHIPRHHGQGAGVPGARCDVGDPSALPEEPRSERWQKGGFRATNTI